MEVDGRHIHVERSGSGPLVVALHSTGMSGRQWGALAARLEDRFTVVRPDWLGCGGSADWPADEPFRLEDDLAVLRAVLADCGGPVHLVGHSYGGTMALWAALEDPARVRSVAVYEPVVFGILHTTRDGEGLAYLNATMRPGFFSEERAGSEAWLSDFVDWWQGPGAWEGLPETAKAPFRRSAHKLYAEVLQQLEDRTSHRVYPRLRVPVTVLYGTETPPPARRAAQLLGELLPRVSVVPVEGAGHMGPLTHAAVVNRAIEGHLAAAQE
jgi:pimeloyl-ACP methyl ester carboxylesterase